MVHVRSVRRSDLNKDRRADPEFYDWRVEAVTTAVWDLGATPLRKWVTSAYRGAAPQYDDHGSVRVIKTAHVRRFFLRDAPAAWVTEQFAAATSRARIPEGSLLITATGVGSAGRTFLKMDSEPMVADAHVTVLPASDPEQAAYVCAYLQSPVGRQQLWRWYRGSSRQVEIYPEDFLAVPVPALGKTQQRSIAERWLAAMERVSATKNAVREAEQRILDRLNLSADLPPSAPASGWSTSLAELQRSRRIDAESRSPTVETLRRRLENAGARSLGSLVTAARKGVQPEEYADGGSVRVIKSKDVRFPDLDLRACDATDEADWPYRLDGGELLVNMTGQGTLGRAGVMPAVVEDDPPTVPSVDVYALDLDRRIAVPEYVALYLGSEIGRTMSESLQTGSSGQQHLYPTHFDDLPILLPLTESGEPDVAFQMEAARIATARGAALKIAREVGQNLDDEFVEAVGVPVDLSTIPS